MALRKDVEGLGMPWEDHQYGYAQAVKVGDTIYVSGAAPLDDSGAGRVAAHSAADAGRGLMIL
jgi:enamine deaminase RidA (YjgF/YER057c/UK114 family)